MHQVVKGKLEWLALALEAAELCTPTQVGRLREELFRKSWDSEQT
jgi:hypothetical protein